MRTALIAALAALSATAWVATPAYAQRHEDRGRHERGDGDRGGRRGDNDDRRGRGEDRGQNQRDRGDRGNRVDRGPRNDGERVLRGGPRDQAAPSVQDFIRRPLERVDRDRGDRDAGRGRGRGDNDGGGNHWTGGGRDGVGRGRGRGDNDGGGNHWTGSGRDGDWRDRDGDGRDGHGRGRGWGDNDGGGNHWTGGDRDRHWRGRDRDFSWNDWGHDRGRDSDRWRRWRHSHSDWDRPRYRDWRHVRHGYYFDRHYALIVSGFWGHNYYWWGYDGWRRPYRPWRVGYILPYDLYWEPIPYDLYYRLPPAPYGCRYVMVDRDILLIAISTGLILDALLYY